VSKLESSNDADVRFGDLIDYMEAVGYEMARLAWCPSVRRIANEVKNALRSSSNGFSGDLVQMTGQRCGYGKGPRRSFSKKLRSTSRSSSKTLAAELPGGEDNSKLVQVEASDVDASGEMRERDEIRGERRAVSPPVEAPAG